MLSKRKRIRRQLRHNKKNMSPYYFASHYSKEVHDDYDHAKAAADKKPHIVRAYKCRYGETPHYHIGKRRTLWLLKRQQQTQ